MLISGFAGELLYSLSRHDREVALADLAGVVVIAWLYLNRLTSMNRT